jgi:hypothetical protein
MATTNIELDIENITGVADADDQFIKTAQKFVVSSIPKDLMLWAGTTTAVGSHGGDSSPTAITLPQPTDNIIDVQRNGFSAEQVPESMQGFIANTASLHKATETFPKYYLQAGNKVIVKPDPSDSETALVNYVDFLKVDDDCDLRGAVVFHAASKEFEKLASAQNSDMGTALTAINTELDETQAICDKIDADLVLAKAEIVLAKAEAAEIASNTDNASGFETACDAMKTELDKVDNIIAEASTEFDKVDNVIVEASTEFDESKNLSGAYNSGVFKTALDALKASVLNAEDEIEDAAKMVANIVLGVAEVTESAADTDTSSSEMLTAANAISTALGKFRTDASDPALFGDETTYLTGTGITRVKAALDKAIALLDGNAPSSTTDVDAWIVDEDSEMAGVVLQAVQAQVGIANTQLQEWTSTVQALSAEAQGFANEVQARGAWTSAKAQVWDGYFASAQSYATAAQTYLASAQGYAGEVQANLNTMQAFIGTGTAYLQEANAYISQGNAYIQEAQAYIAQSNGYAAEVNARAAFVGAKSQAVQGYINTAQSYVATAQGFASEVQSKIGIAQGYGSEIQSRFNIKAEHSKSAERYYKMAQLEVSSYVQNNSKMVNRAMMAQMSQQQAG